MFVIIEGIDRVGKTTLANKLEKDLGFNKYCINNQFPFDNVAHPVSKETIVAEAPLPDDNLWRQAE